MGKTGSTRTITVVIVAVIGFSIASCAVGIGMLTWAFGRMTEERADDHRDVFEHESLRFRLRRPGRGWRLLEPEEAARLNPDASAFAMHTATGTAATVIVEPAYGASLERAADMISGAYLGQGVELGEWRPARVAGQAALRASGAGTAPNGLPMRSAVAIFLHQDYVYQVTCARLGGAGDPPLDTVLDAFELLDGEVVYEPRRIATADGEGPLWRVRGGVLESALGVRLRGDDEWGVLAGPEVSVVDGVADVGIGRTAPPVTITLRAISRPGAAPEQLRARMRDSAVSGFGADPAAVSAPRDETVAGRSVPFARFRVETGFGFDYAHGVLIDGARAFEILAFSPAPGALEAHVGEGLARIELLSAEAQRALEAETADARTDAIAPGVALRGGTFRDYGRGLVWRAPGPCWRGFVGAPADLRELGAMLVVECPRLGIRGALWIAPPAGAGDPSIAHAWAAGELFLGTPPDESGVLQPPSVNWSPAGFGAAVGLESRGEYTADGVPFAYRLLTIERHNASIRWAMWYPREVGAGQVDAAFGAMGVDANAPPAVTSEPGFFADRRLGFAFEARGVEFVDETPPDRQAAARTLVAHDEGLWLFAMHTSGIDSRGVAMETVQARVLADRRLPLGPPEESTGVLAGQPSRVLRWTEGGRRNVLRMVQHGGLIVGMLTTRGLFDDEDSRFADALRFVDP